MGLEDLETDFNVMKVDSKFDSSVVNACYFF